MIELYEHQQKAITKMKNGCVLCGGTGSGKSITALAYFYTKVCNGDLSLQHLPDNPIDLYIITTAKKRDSLDWDTEASKFRIFKDLDSSIANIKLTVDSWNNITKYKKVYGAFFIFDEQRVVGKGKWVKTFLDISRKNKWILLSATPGDNYNDYVPILIANGYFKNRTEFNYKHVMFKRFSKYPIIDRYVDVHILDKYLKNILVTMPFERHTKKHKIVMFCEYDSKKYKSINKDRWDPWEDKPIKDNAKRAFLLRKVCNEDNTRLECLDKIFDKHSKVIIFYNFNYELEILKEYLENKSINYSELNGFKREELPTTSQWAYLVQYQAGAEAWNCTDTNVIVFYSQTYSYKIKTQSEGRIDRINTPYEDLYYYNLRSASSIDNAINRALSMKRNFNEKLFFYQKI